MREYTSSYAFEGKNVTLSHFEPDVPGAVPTVVIVHGSDGFSYGGHAYRLMARRLSENGFAAVMVHYFEATDTTYSDPGTTKQNFRRWREVVKAALRHLAEVSSVDAERVALLGVSLGAFLSVSVAGSWQESQPVLKAVLDYAGGLPNDRLDRMVRMPPVLILHGEDDRVVPVGEAIRLQQALHDLHLRHEVHLYPGEGHRFSHDAAEDAFIRSLVFLRRYL